MKNHFRTAVLTVILAGGTLVSYATAYTVMDWTADKVPAASAASMRPTADTLRQRVSGSTDLSIREACSAFENAATRDRCTQQIGGAVRPVRIIDFAVAGGAETRS